MWRHQGRQRRQGWSGRSGEEALSDEATTPPRDPELLKLARIMASLRAPGGCPWDREQTLGTLRPYLLEEAYEVLEVMDSDEPAVHAEELGDLLFQVVFHARIAADDGRFDLADVARGIHDKLRHRHPHVFPSEQGRKAGAGLGSVDSATDVLANWDIIKKAEKGRESVLDGIPATLPALALAQKVVRRASSLDGAPELPAPKVAVPAQEREFGELLLGLAAVAKKAGIDSPAKMVKKAYDAIQRQRLPDHSYLYGEYLKWKPRRGINRPGGSLGRSHPCNLALDLWGDASVTSDVHKLCLDRLIARNGWLDVARKRPIPHESWFAVAGYFYYYGHYYAAFCIKALPQKEQSLYQKHLAAILVPLQEKDGSWWDFPFYDYHQQYGTAMALMALQRCRVKK